MLTEKRHHGATILGVLTKPLGRSARRTRALATNKLALADASRRSARSARHLAQGACALGIGALALGLPLRHAMALGPTQTPAGQRTLSATDSYPPPPGYRPPQPAPSAASVATPPTAPAPARSEPASAFEFPGISARLDPLNWLISGQLGVELEVELWQFLSLEAVPVFVTTESPFDLDDRVTQRAAFAGALAGSSLGLGFWLGGRAFRGYVLRALLTNYAFDYRVSDDLTRAGGSFVDEAEHTERRLVGLLGSLSRFGAFTLGGGIGIGYELNRERRCISGPPLNVERTCDEQTFQIALDRDGANSFDLNGLLYPFSLEARVSIGITID